MFFHSVEFYVILTVIAALVVGISALPSGTGPVRQYLLAGRAFNCEDTDPAEEPSIELVCRPDGTVLLWRRGLEGIHANGAVSLAINVKGFDVLIEERLTPGRPSDDDTPLTDATFVLNFLGAERYHIRYNSEKTGLMTTCTLHNRPGINVKRVLKR